jgi:hypothetical protein
MGGPETAARRPDWLRLIVYTLALLAVGWFGWLYWRASQIARWAEGDPSVTAEEKSQLEAQAGPWVTVDVDVLDGVESCCLALVGGTPVIAYGSAWGFYRLAWAKTPYPKGGQDDPGYFENRAWWIRELDEIVCLQPEPSEGGARSVGLPLLVSLASVGGHAALLVGNDDGSAHYATAASSPALETDDWVSCYTSLAPDPDYNFFRRNITAPGLLDCDGAPGFFARASASAPLQLVQAAALPPHGPGDWPGWACPAAAGYAEYALTVGGRPGVVYSNSQQLGYVYRTAGGGTTPPGWQHCTIEPEGRAGSLCAADLGGRLAVLWYGSGETAGDDLGELRLSLAAGAAPLAPADFASSQVVSLVTSIPDHLQPGIALAVADGRPVVCYIAAGDTSRSQLAGLATPAHAQDGTGLRLVLLWADSAAPQGPRDWQRSVLWEDGEYRLTSFSLAVQDGRPLVAYTISDGHVWLTRPRRPKQ